MKTETLDRSTTSPDGMSSGVFADANPTSHAIISFKNILVPLALSEMSDTVLRYAVSLALPFGAKITLLHVAEPPVCTPELPVPLPPDLEAIERQLHRIRRTSIPDEVPVDVSIRRSFASSGILETAREIQADIIVMPTHGYTGLKHLLHGSTAEAVVRRAPCPVLVVHEARHESHGEAG